jgi:hypothetical protein
MIKIFKIRHPIKSYQGNYFKILEVQDYFELEGITLSSSHSKNIAIFDNDPLYNKI